MILLYLYAPHLLGSNIIPRIVNNNIHAERSKEELGGKYTVIFMVLWHSLLHVCKKI